MGTFMKHEPCPSCTSRDALARYSNGSAFCFSCGHYISEEGREKFKAETPSDLEDLPECFTALYLPKRRISAAICKQYDYLQGYHKGSFVHAEVYRNAEGNICARKMRNADKSFSWTGDAKAATLFGQHLFKPHEKLSVTITEGAIDALSLAEIHQGKWANVSLKGGAQGAKKELQEQFEWLNGFKEIKLCFDNDEPGRKAIEDCLSIPFAPGKLKVVKLPLKDASEMLQAGKIKELQNCLWQAQVYRPDSVINCKDFTFEMFKGEYTKGLDVAYPKLNSMIHGLHQKRLVVFTSGWGMGKSTLLKELAYELAFKHGKKVGCIFLEEDRSETMKGFMGLHTNTPVIKIQEDEGLTNLLWHKHHEELFDSGLLEIYDHSGEYTPEVLLNRVEYMAAALECDFIIFDHITYLVSGMSGGSEGDRKLIDLLLNKLNQIKLRTGAGVLTACQLRKTGQGQKGINNGGEIELHSLKGSGEIAGIVDVAIGIEGDQQNEERTNDRKFRVLKNRTGGRLGVADDCYYNPTTGRFLPIYQPNIPQQTINRGDPGCLEL